MVARTRLNVTLYANCCLVCPTNSLWKIMRSGVSYKGRHSLCVCYVTNQQTAWNRVLWTWQFLVQSRKVPHCMEPRFSLSCSEKPAPCLCPVPDQSRTCPPILFFKIHFSALPYTVRLGLRNSVCAAGLHIPARTSHPPWFDHPIIFLDQYQTWGCSTCSLLSFPPLRPLYLPKRTILEHPQPMLFPWPKVPGFTVVQTIAVQSPFCFIAWMQVYQTRKLVNWNHNFCFH